uniref:tRNA (guanine(10)-N(2))-methyltransferase TRMT11 n=1 Tax=Meloidogyne enterolobii TaxID=390850 RepID=A0A6V7XQ66_MELEN|nr:unnamed protein product [Meloidogyne enterolobii]
MDKTSCENIFLFVFSQAHPQFRRAEFESICLLFGIQPVPNFTPDESHYQLLHFDGGEAAVRCILGRSVLIKSAFRILINASSHEIVLEQLSKSNILQRYGSSMGLTEAPIDLKNAHNIFTVFEIGINYNNEVNQKSDRILFTKFTGLKNKFALMSRNYIGNSTMDPELAFIQANLVLSSPGSLLIDPFCGTGGILLSAAYFCSHVLGVEIKWDVAKAKGKSSRVGEGLLGSDQSVKANFSQYGLNDGRYLGVILADSSKHKMWRHFGFFDAILADPPYGIRERGQKLGVIQWKRKVETEIKQMEDKKCQEVNQQKQRHRNYPEKQQYQISSVFLDLMDLGVRLLRIGGRLAFWFPVCKSEYSEKILPRSDCLRLVYNCEQPLQKNTARRLLVYEKIKHSLVSENDVLLEKAYVIDNCYSRESFREKIFKNSS